MQNIENLTKETRAALADEGLTDKDWAKMKDGQLPPTNKQKTQAQSIVDQIEALKKHDGLSDAVGFK